MSAFTMVVPSYWGRQGCASTREKIVFDHPTMLDEEGTLGRLLESLRIFERFAGKVVILAVANEPELEDEVRERVDEIIGPFQSRYEVVNMSGRTLVGLRERLREKGVSGAALKLVNFDNYAAVRNMCSLGGILEASDYTIFIDDDEVFTDADFLDKVEEQIGTEVEGGPLSALAGYYLQPDTYRLDERKVPAWRRPYWNNTVTMNEAFEMYIGQGARLKAAPFVFGGNMTLRRAALKQMAFDPNITRGEDIDFLINLWTVGIRFYLDRELAIRHLPPGSNQKAWQKVREDAVRFLYERKKVRDHGIPLEALLPYPGAYLQDDLEERIIGTSALLKQEFEKEGDAEGVAECDKTIEMVRNNPWGDFDTKAWLEELGGNWRELAEAAEGMGINK